MKLGYILATISCTLLLSCGGGRRDAGDFAVWGLDLSKHQPNVEWDALCRDSVPDFVFLKATEGSIIVDPRYDVRARELDKRGILRGAYHFFGHRTSGEEQAENFIRTARLGAGNLRPVLDIEKSRLMKDPARSVREAKVFCREIKREYGVYPIIYCSNLFYHQYLKDAFPAGTFVLWIADYRGEPSDLRWTFWQHTESHKTAGIRGGVDRNVFRGRPGELEKYVLR